MPERLERMIQPLLEKRERGENLTQFEQDMVDIHLAHSFKGKPLSLEDLTRIVGFDPRSHTEEFRQGCFKIQDNPAYHALTDETERIRLLASAHRMFMLFTYGPDYDSQ